jgi:hypothetical protein
MRHSSSVIYNAAGRLSWKHWTFMKDMILVAAAVSEYVRECSHSINSLSKCRYRCVLPLHTYKAVEDGSSKTCRYAKRRCNICFSPHHHLSTNLPNILLNASAPLLPCSPNPSSIPPTKPSVLPLNSSMTRALYSKLPLLSMYLSAYLLTSSSFVFCFKMLMRI